MKILNTNVSVLDCMSIKEINLQRGRHEKENKIFDVT